MNYRRFKKYVKEILPPWELLDIIGYKENKKEILKDNENIKSKKQLEKKLNNVYYDYN